VLRGRYSGVGVVGESMIGECEGRSFGDKTNLEGSMLK
jgi:hypothetical protein